MDTNISRGPDQRYRMDIAREVGLITPLQDLSQTGIPVLCCMDRVNIYLALLHVRDDTFFGGGKC